jgi:hypothetical protein
MGKLNGLRLYVPGAKLDFSAPRRERGLESDRLRASQQKATGCASRPPPRLRKAIATVELRVAP